MFKNLKYKRVSLFLFFIFINFGCLGIGTLLMNNGPQTEWYLSLNKAPWTPPGWFFGFAWSSIMLCFSIYLVKFFEQFPNKKKMLLYTIQVVLNVIWNYIFFNLQEIAFGLAIILLLTILIFYFFFTFKSELKKTSYLLAPYMIWLCVASSLNFYILIYN